MLVGSVKLVNYQHLAHSHFLGHTVRASIAFDREGCWYVFIVIHLWQEWGEENTNSKTNSICYLEVRGEVSRTVESTHSQ